MSKAQGLGLGLVGLGAFAGGIVAFMLFMFSCIGADAGVAELVLAIGVGINITLVSAIPYALATLAKVLIVKCDTKRA